MNDPTTPEDDAPQLDSARVHRALGVFLLVFGVLVLVAVLFTETLEGRLTNLGAGLVLTSIGGVLYFKSGRRPSSRGRIRPE